MSMYRIACPVPHKKINKANNTSVTTSRMGISRCGGDFHRETRIWQGMLK
jgi:hypothetical protein